MWCDLICRLHGRPGEFKDGLWINRHPVPPFYPNVVILKDNDASVRAVLERLAAQLEGSSWAVKDSFGRLDLDSTGLRPLFRAEWITRPANLGGPEPGDADIRWSRIEAADQLDCWEQAWRQAGNDPGDAAWDRMFPPALLAQNDVAVLAASRDGLIVAGAIANLAAGFLGLTNIFTADANSGGTMAGCVRLSAALFPDVPLAGYEAGERLQAMKSLGFAPAGPLTVWGMSADQ